MAEISLPDGRGMLRVSKPDLMLGEDVGPRPAPAAGPLAEAAGTDFECVDSVEAAIAKAGCASGHRSETVLKRSGFTLPPMRPS